MVAMRFILSSILFLLSSVILFGQQFNDSTLSAIELLIPTFLGNYQHNYYGNVAPDNLSENWKFHLGTGVTNISTRKGDRVWSGCGWTGQPLLVKENGILYLIQGAFDYKLKKIRADNCELVWEYAFEDVIKGTGTIFHNTIDTLKENEFIILQGSRRGYGRNLYSSLVPSFRAVSLMTGKELWQLDVWRTPSYSRDMDGSAVVIGDTAYAGLENAVLITFDPSAKGAALKDGLNQPHIYQKTNLFNKNDSRAHGGNIVTESSPCLLNGYLYISSGSGHVYGFNLATGKIDWDFYTGSDIDGSPVVTEDNCLLVTIEKQYIKGPGGVFKLDPEKCPDEAVIWFYPTGNREFASWKGGVIGSACVNDKTRLFGFPALAAFTSINGYLTVVNYLEIDSTKNGLGPNLKHSYPQPQVVFRKYVGASISTPLLVGDKLICAGYNGLKLFQYDADCNFKLLDEKSNCTFESTPIVWNGKLYIGSRNGYLYCLGSEKTD